MGGWSTVLVLSRVRPDPVQALYCSRLERVHNVQVWTGANVD